MRAVSQERQRGLEPLRICDRPTAVAAVADPETAQRHGACPEFTPGTPLLWLEQKNGWGRTGNNLIEFLHAIQKARDTGIHMGIMNPSWALKKLMEMWMSKESPDGWKARWERELCIKVFDSRAEATAAGYQLRAETAEGIFHYESPVDLSTYMETQEYVIRTLLRNHHTGEGVDFFDNPVRDACSGMDSIFGHEHRGSVIYSAVHARALEGGALGMLMIGNKKKGAGISVKSGTDPLGGSELRPDYVKSILEPLGMLSHPIVVITDGQEPEVLQRLIDDPDIGPMVHLVPEEAQWIGGDMTVAMMANVFIGEWVDSAVFQSKQVAASNVFR